MPGSIQTYRWVTSYFMTLIVSNYMPGNRDDGIQAICDHFIMKEQRVEEAEQTSRPCEECDCMWWAERQGGGDHHDI